MGIITLISDWGTRDYYTAAVKGVIYKYNPDAKIVDITHQIEPFNSSQAAYVLKNVIASFPDDTIHIIGINTEESINHPHIVVKYHNQYFIGADDGIFSLIFEENPELIYEIEVSMESSQHTFSSRDRFAKVAAQLSLGGKIEELGSKTDNLETKMTFAPITHNNILKGMVTYIDNYDNLITNISRTDFLKFTKGSSYKISFRTQKYEVTQVMESYGDVRPGEIVALFTSNENLEIAINKGKAASLLGIEISDPVVITTSE